MRLFLDTEFNGFGGALISLALAAEDGREWYGILPLPSFIEPWVKKHVIPYLEIDAKIPLFASSADAQESLGHFLSRYQGAEIIADWPADFEHFCYMLACAGSMQGYSLPWQGTMRLARVFGVNPVIPHNALSDARALKEAYLETEAT